MSNFTISTLMRSGVFFGHTTKRWNPKMAPYIYTTHNKVHIIDLQKTSIMLNHALEVVTRVTASGGKILFVGTKKQVSNIIAEYAEKCGQYHVTKRWLGGMLTNQKTISRSISKLNKLDKQIEEGLAGLTKKEKLSITKTRDKLNDVLGGIRTLNGLPNLIIVFDVVKENIAVEEARKLGIPVIGIVDTNADPTKVTYPVPGNDDAIKSIRLYCDLFSQAVLQGLQEELQSEASKNAAENEPAEEEILQQDRVVNSEGVPQDSVGQ